MKKSLFAILFVFLSASLIEGPASAVGPAGRSVQVKEFLSPTPHMIRDWRGRLGDYPQAVKKDFNDTNWDRITFPLRWEGENTTYWLRCEFSVPTNARGKRLYIELIEVDDEGELYLNGKLKGSFVDDNDVLILLGENYRGGERLNLTLKVQNRTGLGRVKFIGYLLKIERTEEVEEYIKILKEIEGIIYLPISKMKFSVTSPEVCASLKTNDEGWEIINPGHKWQNEKLRGCYRKWLSIPKNVGGIQISRDELEIQFEVIGSAIVSINGEKVGRFSGEGKIKIPPSIKEEEKMLLSIFNQEITGEGGIRWIRFNFSSFEEIVKCAYEVRKELEKIKTFLEQYPDKLEDKRLDLKGIKRAIEVAKLSKDKEEYLQNLEDIKGSLGPLIKLSAKYPPFLKGPYLQNVGKDRITIMWETPNPSSSLVLYGKDKPEQGIFIPDEVKVHEVEIKGLKEGTTYKYIAMSNKLASPEFTFKTAPDESRPFKFAVWGDNRTYPYDHLSVIDVMLSLKPDIAINVGDVVTRGINYEEWGDEYFLPIRQLALGTPTYIAIGNHEYGGYGCGKRVRWFEEFVSHPNDNDYYYSFKYGNSFFIVLDPQRTVHCYDVPPDSTQYKWFVEQLESDEFKNSTFRFVFFHEPPFSECWSGGYYDGEARLRKHIVPLLEKYNVDILFSGHTHDYERGKSPRANTYYIITGGGGAELDDTHYYDWEELSIYKFIYHFCLLTIDGGHLRLQAINREGEVFDSFEIIKEKRREQ